MAGRHGSRSCEGAAHRENMMAVPNERMVMVRAFLALFAAAAPLLAQPSYDILIKGGHVIDPKNKLDAAADVAVAGGKIARVAANIPRESARQIIDATGLYVTPGLID